MPEDMAQSRAWSEHFFSAANLPLSFVLDETLLHGIPSAWTPVPTKRRIDANIAETVSGDDLIRDGLTFALPPRTGAMWFCSQE